MFKELFEALNDSEQASLLVQRNGDELTVTVIPRVADWDSEGEGDEATQQLRAALACPLRLKADPEKLDRVFVLQMREYGQLRTELHGHSSTIEKMRATAAQAKKNATKATADAGKAENTGDNANEQAKTQAETDTDSKASDSSQTKPSSGTQASADKASASTPPPAPSTDNPSGLFG